MIPYEKALSIYNGLTRNEKIWPEERFGQLTNLVKFLEEETTWLKCPASSKYHLAMEGGLLIHSIMVTLTLLRLRQALAPDLDMASCLLCGIFHDVRKLGEPGKPLYVPAQGQKKRYQDFEISQAPVAMGYGLRSLFLISQMVKLSHEEAQAIAYHDGQYIPDNEVVAMKEETLTLLLHYADLWSAKEYESGKREFKLLEKTNEMFNV